MLGWVQAARTPSGIIAPNGTLGCEAEFLLGFVAKQDQRTRDIVYVSQFIGHAHGTKFTDPAMGHLPSERDLEILGGVKAALERLGLPDLLKEPIPMEKGWLTKEGEFFPYGYPAS